jgi:hypothetical protein
MEESAVVLESARNHLKNLAPIARQLNQATNDFTDELRAIEDELARLKLGLDVTLEETVLIWGDMVEEFNEVDETTLRYRENLHLGYGRTGSVERPWGFLVRTFRVYEDSKVFVSDAPLLDSSREIRMAAAGQIDLLLATLTKEANAKLKSLTNAIDKK